MFPTTIDIGVNCGTKHMSKARVARLLADAPDVRDVVSISSSLTECRVNQAKATGMASVWFTAGVHPQRAAHALETSPEVLSIQRALTTHLSHPKCVAVGECGLNYHHGRGSSAAQLLVFEAQVDLALALHMPLYLHCRDAFDDFIGVLRRKAGEGGVLGCGGVVHCFTGTPAQAQAYLDLGLYIGVTGWIFDTARNADLLEALDIIPPHRLVVETDTPWLPCRVGETHSEPRDVVLVAERVAQIKGMDVDVCKFMLFFNTLALFPKMQGATTHARVE